MKKEIAGLAFAAFSIATPLSTEAAIVSYVVSGLTVSNVVNFTAFEANTTVFAPNEDVSLSFSLDTMQACTYDNSSFFSFTDCGNVAVTATNAANTKTQVYNLSLRAYDLDPESFAFVDPIDPNESFAFYKPGQDNGDISSITTATTLVNSYLGLMNMYPSFFGKSSNYHSYYGKRNLSFSIVPDVVSEVPLPGALPLLAGAVGGVALMRRRSGESTPAV